MSQVRLRPVAKIVRSDFVLSTGLADKPVETWLNDTRGVDQVDSKPGREREKPTNHLNTGTNKKRSDYHDTFGGEWKVVGIETISLRG